MFIYAIIEAGRAQNFGLIGIKGSSVICVVEGELAAVVSRIAEARVRPERANLAAHSAVVRQLTESGACLPLAFGTIANDEATVRKLLRDRSKTFSDQLRYFNDTVEMGLRVRFDVPNIYEYIMDSHPELKELRDSVYGNHRDPARDAKVELGRLFDRLLASDREAHTDKVLSVLGKICIEVKDSAPRNDMEIMNLACLVKRGKIEEFENAVMTAAGQFDNNFSFDYSGPWAPYNFVNIHLDAMSLNADH